MFRPLVAHHQVAHSCTKQMLNVLVSCMWQNLPEIPQCVIYRVYM